MVHPVAVANRLNVELGQALADLSLGKVRDDEIDPTRPTTGGSTSSRNRKALDPGDLGTRSQSELEA